jgi:predicted dehydrogenase
LHAVGFNRRFSPVLTRMKHIAEDTIGNTPLAASCEFTRVDRYDLDFATTLIHGLDALRFLAGDFERVNMCRPSVQTTPPSFCAEISGTLANGATVRLNAAAAVGDARERYALFGRGVTLEAAVAMPGLPETGSVRLWRDGALCLDLNERAMGIHGAPDCLRSGILPQARQFLDAVASGHGPAGITFTESLQSVELADFARGNGGVWFAFDGTRPDAL